MHKADAEMHELGPVCTLILSIGKLVDDAVQPGESNIPLPAEEGNV